MSERQAQTQIWVSTACIVVLATFWTPLWRFISHEWFGVLNMIEIGHKEDGWTREEYEFFPQVFDHLMAVFCWILFILVGASWRLTPFCPEGTQRQLAYVRSGLATMFFLGFVISLFFRIAPVVQEVDLTARSSALCIAELQRIEEAKKAWLNDHPDPGPEPMAEVESFPESLEELEPYLHARCFRTLCATSRSSHYRLG